jgi:nitroreductase
MNEVIQTILARRAVRKYEDKPVSREDLELIVKCGQYAATGMGFQPWHFTVVTDRAVLDKLAKANGEIMQSDPNTPPFLLDEIKNGTFDPYRGAPCAILVSGENDKQNTVADCANAVENMAIAAKSLGLDTCYLASYQLCLNAPNGGALKAELGIPEGYIPNFALSIGYGAEKPEPAPRREGTVNWL